MNILLVCACGSSTSILVSSMINARSAEEQDWNIEALSVSDGKKVFGKYDYILLAPQVKYQMGMIKDLCKDLLDVTLMSIDARDFGRCNGNNVLDMIRENERNKK